MSKPKLISSLGGAVAVSLLSVPIAQTSESPFAMQKVNDARLIELLQEGFSTGKQALLELAAEMHYGNHETILPCNYSACFIKAIDLSVISTSGRNLKY